jgi:hypothetical protein
MTWVHQGDASSSIHDTTRHKAEPSRDPRRWLRPLCRARGGPSRYALVLAVVGPVSTRARRGANSSLHGLRFQTERGASPRT